MLISVVLQSDSDTFKCILYILFHCGLSQDIEYSFLCFTVEICFLSILYIRVCIQFIFFKIRFLRKNMYLAF